MLLGFNREDLPESFRFYSDGSFECACLGCGEPLLYAHEEVATLTICGDKLTGVLCVPCNERHLCFGCGMDLPEGVRPVCDCCSDLYDVPDDA